MEISQDQLKLYCILQVISGQIVGEDSEQNFLPSQVTFGGGTNSCSSPS